MTIQESATAEAPAAKVESQELTQSLSDNPALKEALIGVKASDKAPDASAPAAEPPKAEALPDKKEEDRFSRKFAELSRREKEFQKQKQEFTEQQKELADYKKKLKDAEDDPIAFLEANGLSYEKLTDHVLSGKKDPALKKLEKELQSEREARLQEKKDKEKRDAEKALADFKSETKQKIQSAGETYQLVNALDQHDLVHEVIQEHFERTKDPETGVGEILKTEEAAKMVEEHFEKQLERLKDLPKFKKFLSVPAKGSEPAKDDAKAEIASKKSTTLSNDLAQDATEPAGTLSEEEAKEKMLRLLKWS